MAVLCVTTGDCVQWAVYSVVFSGTVTGSVCDKTSTVCLWTQWGLCSHGSSVDVRPVWMCSVSVFPFPRRLVAQI